MALTAKKVYAILKRQISDMEAKLNSPVRYRGTVATADLLPLNPDIGDMYNIESKSVYGEAGMNVAWNGVVWDTMGAPIDMSLYLTKEEADAVIQRLVTEYFEKNPVKPGATTEQAQQIEQNKTDIASLKTETSSLKKDLGEINETVNTAFPSVAKTNTINITKKMMTFIGNKFPNATGGLKNHSSYWGYTYIVPYDGKLFVSNLGNSSFGYLAVYNNSVSDENLVSGRMESANTVPFFQPINVTKGQIVLLSVALTTDSESDVELTSNTTLTYTCNDRPTLFQHEMNIAWFGDSISQLQLLPHRTAEYMGCSVNDCSFAGANLSIAGTTSSISVLEISKMIVSGNWTRLEDYLTAQKKEGIDITEKRKNADTLEGLDFTKVTDIVIMIGTNDLNNDYVTTTSSLEVFKESMQNIINNINGKYPAIRIYFISNPYRGDITPETPDKHGHSLIDIIDAETEIAEKNNIPYYDLYHNSGINANTISYFLTPDKLHQNEYGDILMAQKCAKWLMSN